MEERSGIREVRRRGVWVEDSALRTLDGGEQEDRSPMATGTFCQIQVSKLQRDTSGGRQEGMEGRLKRRGGGMVCNRNNQRD